MTPAAQLAREIERCDREIAAMSGQDAAPAYLVTMGQEDWRWERRELERMLDAGLYLSTAAGVCAALDRP